MWFVFQSFSLDATTAELSPATKRMAIVQHWRQL